MDRNELTLPAALIIMDGFGMEKAGPGNAISLARTPVLDRVFRECPFMELSASGEAVGLPDGQMGNSEVGHLNIGAGRVVYQDLTRINRACADGSLEQNVVLHRAFSQACQEGAVLHLMGLLSDGGVHSSNQHLFALLRMARQMGVPQVRVHCFMDGRDVSPTSGAGFVEELARVCQELSSSECSLGIGSVSGRYYAMDRDNRWERVEQAYHCLVCADGFQEADPVQVIQRSYEQGVTDEFVVPVCFDRRGVQDGDSVVFFNFRPDRARQLTRTFVDAGFCGFERKKTPQVSFVCMTEYDASLDVPVAFPKEFPANVLADVLACAGLRQYHIAETEKYAHVTFFFKGGVEAPKEGEERKLIPSPKVATYDLQPQMSAPLVAQELAQAIDRDQADVYIVNFANCDMVGHTGVIPAAVEAVQAVDEALGVVLSALERKKGVALVTADHGNADCMLAEDGSPFTAHTTAPVPLALVDCSGSGFRLSGAQGALCDLSPTLLDMIGLHIPAEMTGTSLIQR